MIRHIFIIDAIYPNALLPSVPPPFSGSKIIGVDVRLKSLEIKGSKFLARKKAGKLTCAEFPLLAVVFDRPIADKKAWKT